MAKTIWKYRLSSAPTADVMMPPGAQVMHVGAQGEAVVLWAIVDRDVMPERRVFTVLGTDFSAPDNLDAYLGTAQTTDGFVWHVFEGYV